MADTRISDETAASALTGTELIEAVQDGSNVNITPAQIKTYTSAAPTITGHASIEGNTLTGKTGTGKIVFDNAPTISTSLTIGAGSAITTSGPGGALASGAFAAAYVLPSATTEILGGVILDGTTIDVNTDGTISAIAGAATLAVGSSSISGGTTTRILYDNAGTLGEYTITGTGTEVAMSNAPTLVTPKIGGATLQQPSAGTFNFNLPATAGISGDILTSGGGSSAPMTWTTPIAINDLAVTWNNAGTTFTAIKMDVTDSNSQSASLLQDLQVSTASKYSVRKDGLVTSASGSMVLGGKTLTLSNTLTFAGTDSTTMTFPPASASIGYLGVPINAQNAGYTCVLADAGKAILMQTAGTFTIPANSGGGSVAFPVGTVIGFINGAAESTIPITTDTMTLAGTATTGTRTLAANGIATAIKIASTSWIISGTGLT